MLASSPLHFRGLGLSGALGAGGAFHIPGRIANLDILSGPLGHILAQYLHAEHHPNGRILPPAITSATAFPAYLDNQLLTTTRPARLLETDPLPQGPHELAIIPIPANSPGYPTTLIGNTSNDRIHLRWPPNTDADLAAYLIYTDNATGTISYTTPIATITNPDLNPRWRALPDSGTGTGRLTINGTYRGTTPAAYRLKIVSAGNCRYSLDSGATYSPADIPFAQGTTLNLPNGPRITFLDPATTYATNDYWDITIALPNYHTTAALDAGTYKHAVKTRDLAGNISTGDPITATTTLTPAPPAPIDPTATWDPDTHTITVQWTTPFPEPDAVNLYANWDPILGRLDTINEYHPIATINAGGWGVDDLITHDITLTGQPGNIYLYARSITSGTEEHNATLITVECNAAPASPTLTAPQILTAEPGPAGVIILTYSIDWATATPSFIAIYIHNTATPDWATATPAETVAYTPDQWSVSVQTYTTAPLTGTHYFTIRAIDANGLETLNTDVTPATSDTTPPADITALTSY